jgi:C_GCAxxG_C_C family probable redox protein
MISVRRRSLVSTNSSQRALELFLQDYNCAQSVYAASATGTSLSETQRLAQAAPFGGGVARQGEICGALTGALMAMGEFHTEALAADRTAAQALLYARAQQLVDTFRKAHGAVTCRELTGCSLSTEAGHRAFKETGVRDKVCVKLVAFAAEQVTKQMAEVSSHK